MEKKLSGVALGHFLFEVIRGHFCLAAAINQHGFFRPEPLGLCDRVNGGIAAADDRDAIAHRHLVKWLGVNLLDEIQGLDELWQILAENVQPGPAAQSQADEERVELLFQLAYRDASADLDSAAELDAA